MSPEAPATKPSAAGSRAPFDPETIRGDFPILGERIHGKPLVYLDNAATTQRPNAVLEAIDSFYRSDNANVHRGVHELSQRATRRYEAARGKVARFLNAREDSEVVFVRGTTEAINLVAASWGRANLRPGDEILLSHMEHHSNIVPWQAAAGAAGASLRVIPVDDRGELVLEEYERLLSPRTRLVGIVHVSNALGTVNPVRRIAAMAHRAGALVLVDGAQSAPHLRVDVQEIGCDFFAFSGHKIYGPTGIGALWARKDLLDAMPPWQAGGDMIRTVSFEKSTWNAVPQKFEAGTPNIAGAVGLGAAIDYLERIGFDAAADWENDLLEYATAALGTVPGLRIVGTAREKASVISFDLEGVHPHDLGTILDQEGVAVRSGHHCAMPLMVRYGLAATTRASLSFYNTRAEIDRLVEAIGRVREVFA